MKFCCQRQKLISVCGPLLQIGRGVRKEHEHEIDLLQENRNKDIKKSIKTMGANKTDLAIERSSKSCGSKR